MALANKLRKLTVLLSPEQFERFEEYCQEQGYKKSTLVARLIRELLETEKDKNNGGHKRSGNK